MPTGGTSFAGFVGSPIREVASFERFWWPVSAVSGCAIVTEVVDFEEGFPDFLGQTNRNEFRL